VLTLDVFGRMLLEAADKSAPNLIAEHAWRLAQAFSRFYAACPVLLAPPPIASSRLALAELSLRQLSMALDILGIDVPDRM
ncbi:MAG: DALR anticodon-binding domain-containing protein, partial [Caulobacteraceae bacterium]